MGHQWTGMKKFRTVRFFGIALFDIPDLQCNQCYTPSGEHDVQWHAEDHVLLLGGPRKHLVV